MERVKEAGKPNLVGEAMGQPRVDAREHAISMQQAHLQL
jgi:hypothetical protein